MTVHAAPGVDVRRAGDRLWTRLGWLDSRHSFSFGGHHDPANTHHGLLLVSNDDVIEAGTGFMTHPHRDMEIVTWVLEGELEHKDSEGHHGIIYPGLAQRMSAGTGILHSEMNARNDASVRLVQMWVVPDRAKIRPGYAQLDINSELSRGELVAVASGRGHDAAIGIQQEGAVLWAGRLAPGARVLVPEAPFVHVFVATGDAELEAAGRLEQGDAARLNGAGGLGLTAGPSGAEVLIWEMGGAIQWR